VHQVIKICLYVFDEGLVFNPTQQVSPHPFNWGQEQIQFKRHSVPLLNMTQFIRSNKSAVPNTASCLIHITSTVQWEEYHRWRVAKWEICTDTTVWKRKHVHDRLNVTSLNTSETSYETIPDIPDRKHFR